MLSTSDFTYDLPQSSIAQEPVHPRDKARLLVLDRQSGNFSHTHFFNLPRYLDNSCVLVVNNTKVIPARLYATKPTGGRIEILLLEKLSPKAYVALTKPGLSIGQTLTISPNFHAVCTRGDGLEKTLEFSLSGRSLDQAIMKLGSMPIPPYIIKKLEDPQEYQTVYAKRSGSAAAPTAGLHFTPHLLDELTSRGVEIFEVTLHVGLGTFRPVKPGHIHDHYMHKERYSITAETALALNKAKKDGKTIVAVGTTTVRTLESNLTSNGEVLEGNGNTDIFIYPPYRFRFVDAMITNFHLPHSTLLMMVSAFTTHPNTPHRFTTFSNSIIGAAYKEAIDKGYRFFSFGDAMLIR